MNRQQRNHMVGVSDNTMKKIKQSKKEFLEKPLILPVRILRWAPDPVIVIRTPGDPSAW